MISTFTPHISTGTWIGYQIIAGVGRGCALQMVATLYSDRLLTDFINTFEQPLIAVQNNLPASKIAVSMAFVYFCQTFGGSLWLSFAETAFDTGLENDLPSYAPGVSVAEVVLAGVSGIRSVIPQASVEGVVMAYNNAIQHVFYMVAGTATAAFVFSWGLGWKSIKKKNVSPEA